MDNLLPLQNQARWQNIDPRLLIDKKKKISIIILRPSKYGWEPGTGNVDTKENWCVSTSFLDPIIYISVDDKWNKGWMWTYAPNLKNE